MGWVALFATLATLGMGGCAYFKEWQQLPTKKAEEATVYVVSHGWHTGIVIARDQLGERLQFVPKELGDAAHYEFGWGEKDFYEAPKNSIWLAIQAAFWLNDSVMHVVAVKDSPAKDFPDSEIIELHVAAQALSVLTAAIADSFAATGNDEPRSTRDGLYGHSRFFNGAGTYYLLNTCNTWTARMLATAGVPTSEVLTLTAGSVMRQSKWAAEKYVCCAE
jgi:uncharacterized protein (TIGR02117 family)